LTEDGVIVNPALVPPTMADAAAPSS
jgi:hypothetical protein